MSSNKPFMVFTGTEPENSIKGYLNAVIINLIFNLDPEPVKTPLYQNWIHRRSALIEITFDDAAQK